MSRNRCRGAVEEAIESLRTGDPVLIHDGGDREDETDLVYPADAVDPAAVARLRSDAGGLICVAVPAAVADAFELPFLEDALSHASSGSDHIEYDDRSSFSIPVNHVGTETGITDRDRSRTITRLARAASVPAAVDFASEFSSPGHVPLLRAADGLLDARRGHTEYGISLVTQTDRAPAVTVCEMLDAETGEALSRRKAKQYARTHGYTFVDGEDICTHLA